MATRAAEQIYNLHCAKYKTRNRQRFKFKIRVFYEQTRL